MTSERSSKRNKILFNSRVKKNLQAKSSATGAQYNTEKIYK